MINFGSRTLGYTHTYTHNFINFFMLFSSSDVLLQFFKALNITSDHKKIFRKAFHTYYDAAAELLQAEHTVRVLLPTIACISVVWWHDDCWNLFPNFFWKFFFPILPFSHLVMSFFLSFLIWVTSTNGTWKRKNPKCQRGA